MTNDGWSDKRVENRASSFTNLVQPAWLGMYVEISLAVIAKRPYPSLGVIPCDPRRGRIKAVTDRDVCASIDELPEQLCESAR